MIIRKTTYIYILVLSLFPAYLHSEECTRQDSIRQFHSICTEIENSMYTHPGRADSLIDELSVLSRRLGNTTEFYSRTIYRQASLAYAAEQPIEQPADLHQRMQQCDSVRHPFEYGLLHFSLSMIQSLSNEYPNALNSSMKALQYMEKADHPEYIAKINASIGNLFKTIGEYNNSIAYSRKALNYYQTSNDRKQQLKLCLQIYTSMFYSGEKEKAIGGMTELIPQIKAAGDTYLLTATYTNLGSCLAQNNRKTESFENYKKALELSRTIENEYVTITILHNIGAYYLRMNRPDSCLKYLKRAESYYIRHQIKPRLLGTYVGLAQSYSQKQQYDSAYYNLTRYDSIRNNLLNIERLSLVNKTEAKYLSANYQNQLKLARDEYMLKKKQTIIVIISSVGIILIVLLSLLIVTKQKKIVLQQKELKEKENALLNEKLIQEANLAKQQKQAFTQTIDSRNREISTSLLLLSNKNLVLSRIRQLTDNYNADKSDLEDYKKEVNALIESCINIDEEWDEFKIHFEQVHPLFFSKLKQISRELTENELRLCVYIKIGMRAKEIAQLLCVSPDSVKMSRYRLKKKLNTGEVSIDDFLREL